MKDYFSMQSSRQLASTLGNWVANYCVSPGEKARGSDEYYVSMVRATARFMGSVTIDVDPGAETFTEVMNSTHFVSPPTNEAK